MKTKFIVKAHWEEVNTESEFCVYKNQPYMHFTENDFYVFQFPSLKAQRNFFKEGFRKIENDVEGDAKAMYVNEENNVTFIPISAGSTQYYDYAALMINYTGRH